MALFKHRFRTLATVASNTSRNRHCEFLCFLPDRSLRTCLFSPAPCVPRTSRRAPCTSKLSASRKQAALPCCGNLRPVKTKSTLKAFSNLRLRHVVLQLLHGPIPTNRTLRQPRTRHLGWQHGRRTFVAVRQSFSNRDGNSPGHCMPQRAFFAINYSSPVAHVQ